MRGLLASSDIDLKVTNNMLQVAGVLLIVTTAIDLWRRRLPNMLTLGSVVLGLLVLVLFESGSTVAHFGLGWLVGLGLFLPFYIAGGFAAGDVKLMAAAGAFVGPKIALFSVAATLIAGGVLAVLFILRHHGLKTTVARYKHMFRVLHTTGKWIYIPAVEGEAALQRFPYALAIFIGTGIGIWLETQTLFGLSLSV